MKKIGLPNKTLFRALHLFFVVERYPELEALALLAKPRKRQHRRQSTGSSKKEKSTRRASFQGSNVSLCVCQPNHNFHSFVDFYFSVMMIYLKLNSLLFLGILDQTTPRVGTQRHKICSIYHPMLVLLDF